MKNLKNFTFFFAILFCFSISSFAQSSSYFKIGDINGTTTTAGDANHDKWIDVLSIDWGSHKPGGGATGQSRRRGGAVVEDVTLTIDYEKASPKLLEKMNMGEVIPKLEIEQTSNYGGSRATYLKYELTNVLVTSFQTNARSRAPIAKVSLKCSQVRRIR